MTETLTDAADLTPTTWLLKRGRVEIEIAVTGDKFRINDNAALFLSATATTFEDALAAAEEMASDYDEMETHYRRIEAIKDRWRRKDG